jgi:hypothetical protein
VPAQPVDATPSDINLFSKGGVYDARETGEAFRGAEDRPVEPVEGGTVTASDWARLRQEPCVDSLHVVGCSGRGDEGLEAPHEFSLALLELKGFGIKHSKVGKKLVYRLYREEGLTLRYKARRRSGNEPPRACKATAPNPHLEAHLAISRGTRARAHRAAQFRSD